MQLTQAQLGAMEQRDPAIVDTVVIHHSDADKRLDITEIAAMEQKSQGFITVGYHAYLKCLDVSTDSWAVQIGRPIGDVPAAALGDNLKSYDICVGGNYQPGAQSWTDSVSEKALHLVAAQILEAKAKLPNLKYLIGHRDVTLKVTHDPNDATACPGYLLYARLHDLRVLTGLSDYPT